MRLHNAEEQKIQEFATDISSYQCIQGDPKFMNSEYRTWYFMLKETAFSFYKIASNK